MTLNKNEIWDWVKTIAIAILLAFAVRVIFLTPIEVKGQSMEPTLQENERMIVTKVGQPKRFDIIVFHSPVEDKDYIKRVIGLPGDRIEYIEDVLYINGKAYDEPYLEDSKKSLAFGWLTGTFTLKDTPVNSDVVPEGHLFVLGDNRRHSKDSRSFGAVPFESIIGTTKVIFYPLDEMKILGN
ncbi:signal peptidase I [Mesobacillus subterraneus]|uniref:Signal peptidase I n=1 Tax=Mesobacillus subterraneus TaxID=285983 RepID=A0A3R9KY33_9BACI|nr:signal peptidase I [Mesobacillus subterraneus]RSD28706.1 signal peptidase I [Mesobacillus subterraneus]